MKTLGSIALARHRREAHAEYPLCEVRPPRPVPLDLVAHRAGVGKAMMSHLELGVRKPGLSLALKLQEMGVCDPADWERPATEPSGTRGTASTISSQHRAANTAEAVAGGQS